jgi:hypothetical protein
MTLSFSNNTSFSLLSISLISNFRFHQLNDFWRYSVMCYSPLQSPIDVPNPQRARVRELTTTDMENIRVSDTFVLVHRKCNNAFHHSCLASWLSRGHWSCPICRYSLSGSK